MKKLLALVLLMVTTPVFASGGFTWIGAIINKFHLPIAEHVFGLILVGALLIIGSIIYRTKLSKADNVLVPDRGFTFRNLVEVYGQMIYGQCRMVLGEDLAKKHFTFIATVFLVILTANLIGLIPGFLPATEHLSTTFAFGCFVFIYYNFFGFKEMGVINYLKHFAGPIWYMAVLIFPLEIISNLIRPCSLALRLRGNMMGDHMVLTTFSKLGLDIHHYFGETIFGAIITSVIPALMPLPFYLLGILVNCIQAYVFTMLTMIYISLAAPHHDHAEQADH